MAPHHRRDLVRRSPVSDPTGPIGTAAANAFTRNLLEEIGYALASCDHMTKVLNCLITDQPNISLCLLRTRAFRPATNKSAKVVPVVMRALQPNAPFETFLSANVSSCYCERSCFMSL